MGRRSNYSCEFKLKCVKEYLNGKSYSQAARENGLPKDGHHSVKGWVKKYLQKGSAAFEYSSVNTKYSDDVKRKAVQDYLESKGSYMKESENAMKKKDGASNGCARFWGSAEAPTMPDAIENHPENWKTVSCLKQSVMSMKTIMDFLDTESVTTLFKKKI